MPRSNAPTVRSVHDRAARAQRAYLLRLREALDALHPLLEQDDAGAVKLARAIETEIAHISYGSALDD